MSAPNQSDSRRSGPLDDAPWPDKLTARVVTPGTKPAIHGYDVEEDLARHYTFAETVLLSLTGNLPSGAQTRALEIAMLFLSPSPVSSAPSHAAVIARICDVMTSAIIGTAAIGLAEQARVEVNARAAWIRCLESASDDSGVPAPRDDAERASVDRLRKALRASSITISALDHDLDRIAAIMATLHFAGLRHAEQLEAVFVLARLPATLAEAFATPAHSFRDYPVDLPPIRYIE